MGLVLKRVNSSFTLEHQKGSRLTKQALRWTDITFGGITADAGVRNAKSEAVDMEHRLWRTLSDDQPNISVGS